MIVGEGSKGLKFSQNISNIAVSWVLNIWFTPNLASNTQLTQYGDRWEEYTIIGLEGGN